MEGARGPPEGVRAFSHEKRGGTSMVEKHHGRVEGKERAQHGWPTHDGIAKRAYELYLARGATPGHALDDWLEAERQLTAEVDVPVPRPTRSKRR